MLTGHGCGQIHHTLACWWRRRERRVEERAASAFVNGYAVGLRWFSGWACVGSRTRSLERSPHDATPPCTPRRTREARGPGLVSYCYCGGHPGPRPVRTLRGRSQKRHAPRHSGLRSGLRTRVDSLECSGKHIRGNTSMSCMLPLLLLLVSTPRFTRNENAGP